jgi:hypothetical protein
MLHAGIIGRVAAGREASVDAEAVMEDRRRLQGSSLRVVSADDSGGDQRHAGVGMGMRMPIGVAVAATLTLVLELAPAGSALAQQRSGAANSDLSAPQRNQRARTRLRVQPLYPYRGYSTNYPTPYPIEAPGPNTVRQCTAWLATEHRVSGTYVVPRTHCWWEPG